MTIATTARTVTYNCNGSTTGFAVPFQFRAAADLRVTLIAADGSETVKALTTHYTVSGGGNPPATGNVTMLAAPADGTRLLIEGAKTIAQARSWQAGDRDPPEAKEGSADDAAIHAQELRRDVNDTRARAPMVPRGETAPNFTSLSGRTGEFLQIVGGQIEPIAKAPFAGKVYGGDTYGAPMPVALRDSGGLDTLATLADPDAGSRAMAHRRAAASPFIARDLREHLNDFALSLKEAGAAGDDSTDDTDAIVEAIEYCLAHNKALRVPEGIYRHGDLSFAPALRAGLRIFGDWGGDYDPSSHGAIFRHTGTGKALTFDGDSGPLYMDLQGIAFVGNANSAGGLEVRGRSTFRIRDCGFLGFSKDGAPCVRLTRGEEPFVGVARVQDCTFAYGSTGVVIDRPITNVIDLWVNRFVDMEIGIQGRADIGVDAAEGRQLNFIGNYFEGQAGLRHVLDWDGSAFNMTLSHSYIEQNSTEINDPLIWLKQSTPGALYRSINIHDNFIQKQLGAADTAIIDVTRCGGLKIYSNGCAFGGDTERFFARVSGSVDDGYIELPQAPNGVTPYPIRNTGGSGATYARSHWTNEGRSWTPVLKGDGAATAQTATGKHADRDGVVTVDFDITLTAEPESGWVRITGLPFPNGAQTAPVTVTFLENFATYVGVAGYIAPGASEISLIAYYSGGGISAGPGGQFDCATAFSNGSKIKGQAVYRKA